MLSDGSGAVFGRLFRTGHELESSRPLDQDESARIVASRGTHLVSHYWGRYVAVRPRPAKQ